MPAVVITLPTSQTRPTKARFVDAQGNEWVFPHAPQDVEHSGRASRITDADRPDRLPLVERAGQQVPRCKIRWTLTRRFTDQPIENSLDRLGALLGDGKLIRFEYGPSEAGWWICEDHSYTVTQRTDANEAGRADVAVDLVRAVDPDTAAPVSQVRTPINIVNIF